MLAGVPSVFLRTSGCNLRCAWCDTPYASWEPEGREWSVAALLDFVAAESPLHVVITGGEPMIARGIVPLTEGLRRLGRHITIETAGTVFAPVACDLMSLSPKLSNSTPVDRDGGRWVERHERLRIRPEVLRRLMDVCPYQFKFVVAAPGDLEEIRALVRDLAADTSRVVLMPEGADPDLLRERGRWVAETAVREGFRYSPRLQIELWGNRRGV